MSSKYLLSALLLSLAATSASAAPADNDPVRARVQAELAQAQRDGSYPPSEADYVYPNWVKIANPAGLVMTDGHQDNDRSNYTAGIAARGVESVNTVALMSDGHPELENRAGTPAARPQTAVAQASGTAQGSVKGGGSAQ